MPARTGQRRTIRLVHFSDYHAHATPFYAEGEHHTAGIARLVEYLRSVRSDAVVTNGGDMLNVGAPAWSDRYQGLEWPWLNGLVDVMALGNHDSDYGPEVFDRCRRSIDHPILCANLLDQHGRPGLLHEGRPYLVKDVDGVRLGLLAAGGPDLEELVPPSMRPLPGSRFADRVPVVEQLVHRMRTEDRVDAVIVVGHGHHADDVVLAQAVQGIDVILGTHSHRREELTTIPGTDTVTVSPFQYATHVADLRLQFHGGALVDVDGGLVRMNADRPQAPDVAATVARLATELEQDDTYAYLFEELGHAPAPITQDGQADGESPLGNLVTDVLREACDADVAVIGASAMREPIAPGPVRVGDVLTALPYRNHLFVYRLRGDQLQALLDIGAGHRGSNFHAQVSGVRFRSAAGAAVGVQIEDAGAGVWRPLDADRIHEVVVNDFTADYIPGYREFLADQPRRPTGLELRETLMRAIRTSGHVTSGLDGRIVTEAAPAGVGVP